MKKRQSNLYIYKKNFRSEIKPMIKNLQDQPY